MYQTLQSTGSCWHLCLHINGTGKTLDLAYGQRFHEVIKRIQPGIELRVKPDAILGRWFEQTSDGLKLRQRDRIRRLKKGYSLLKSKPVKCIKIQPAWSKK